MSRLVSLTKRITPTLFLLLAVGGALLIVTPRRAGATANCKPNRATCTANQQCCSGACTAGLCGTPTTTTTSTTSTTTSSTTTTTTTSTTTTTLACQAFPATGQTTCWDSSGTVISCTGTGQDGDLQKGAPLSYTDNGDGTITDNNTGLVWEKQSQDGTIHDKTNYYTWDEAFSVHVAGLNAMNFAGHSDWRVPNVKELQSIVNYENYGPAVSSAFNIGCSYCPGGPGCDSTCTVVSACSCTVSEPYWSSTTSRDGPDGAWLVAFAAGQVQGAGKNYLLALVRGVRGGS